MVEGLEALQFQPIEAELLGAFAPIALGRYFTSPMEEFRYVTFPDSIKIPADDGDQYVKVRLDQIAFYRFILSAGVEALERGALTNKEFTLIAMRSPENKVLNSMLHEGQSLDGLVLGALRVPRLKLDWVKLLK